MCGLPEIDMDFDGNPFDIVFEIYSFILPEISSIQTRDVNGVIQTVDAEEIDQTNSSLSWKNMHAHKILNQDGIRGIDLLSCSQIFRQLCKG